MKTSSDISPNFLGIIKSIHPDLPDYKYRDETWKDFHDRITESIMTLRDKFGISYKDLCTVPLGIPDTEYTNTYCPDPYFFCKTVTMLAELLQDLSQLEYIIPRKTPDGKYVIGIEENMITLGYGGGSCPQLFQIMDIKPSHRNNPDHRQVMIQLLKGETHETIISHEFDHIPAVYELIPFIPKYQPWSMDLYRGAHFVKKINLR